MEKTIACIDIGTTKVCALVGEVSEAGTLRIVGVGIAPSRGMRKGVVINVGEATEAIASAVERAERISGYQIGRAYVGVAGEHISSVNSRGVVAVSHSDRGITQEDVDRAVDAAQAIAIPYNREVIHIVPRGFTLDGQDGVREPVGMHGFRLEVETHIVTGATTSIQNLVKCVEDLEIEVDELVLAPLASGEAVLTDTEREMGVVLADLGGGTTDITIFIEGSVWHSTVLGVGGNHVTNDIAIGLRTPFTIAEELKKKYGHAREEAVRSTETFDMAAFGDEAPQVVPRQYLAKIVEARMGEIFDLILREIKRSGYDGLLPAGVVLCGGASQLTGITELGREVLNLPVRVGLPSDLHGLVDVLSNPAYATSVGLLLWGLRQRAAVRPRPRGAPIHRRMTQWMKSFLPG